MSAAAVGGGKGEVDEVDEVDELEEDEAWLMATGTLFQGDRTVSSERFEFVRLDNNSDVVYDTYREYKDALVAAQLNITTLLHNLIKQNISFKVLGFLLGINVVVDAVNRGLASDVAALVLRGEVLLHLRVAAVQHAIINLAATFRVHRPTAQRCLLGASASHSTRNFSNRSEATVNSSLSSVEAASSMGLNRLVT
ncbi:unnamed protein product [Phytophthora fragariaefolia]|uniref:Unnamed protein product n=1 Tax=Phytophthora fragariaefolia TaxID=1490495 RepID=A0A9W7D4J6_9STRA|nr:unnamed protein product [Phytophthora fragariaefolia]